MHDPSNAAQEHPPVLSDKRRTMESMSLAELLYAVLIEPDDWLTRSNDEEEFLGKDESCTL